MIRLHHLHQSRSLRILWLLEALSIPYELVSYQRNPQTQLAPDSLKKVHPLGKSPVIDIDGQMVAESGAITQLLIERFAADTLRPSVDSVEYGQYLQWIDFAESSLMLPLLLELFTQKAGVGDNAFLSGYIAQEKGKLLSYLDEALKGKAFIVGDSLSGADFMLSFNVMMMSQRNLLGDYPHIEAYAQSLAMLPSYQKALRIENSSSGSSI